jgi:tetratricopeptide (TPR) repeat protein
MPVFSVQAIAPVGEEVSAKKAISNNAAAISCGSCVRVVKPERSRQATISYVDEDEGTVDVMYSASPSGPEEEEGLKLKSIQALLPFEMVSRADEAANLSSSQTFYKTASAIKDEGNQLYKLKDFDAAIERYSRIIAAFAAKPRTHTQVLMVTNANGTKPELKDFVVRSCDAEGTCELTNGDEVASADVLPVFQELLVLQAAAYMNRARCEQAIGCHSDAAKDLTVVLGLWETADKRMLEADMEMREAKEKGLYTAQYLRAKSRLARGFLKQAASDVKAALGRKPPPPVATQKQLRELNTQIQAALEEYRRLNGPLAKELAKVSIALRGMNKLR